MLKTVNGTDERIELDNWKDYSKYRKLLILAILTILHSNENTQINK